MPYLHELTFPEIQTSKTAVWDIGGSLWGGPDRKGMNAPNPDNLFLHWQRQVERAQEAGKAVPENVMQFYYNTKDLGHAPRSAEKLSRGGDMSLCLNCTDHDGTSAAECNTRRGVGLTAPKKKLANPPRFTWSYTAIQDFLTCPYQFAAKRYFKTLKEAPSKEMLWGQQVHKAFENAVLGRASAQDLATLKEIGGDKYVDAFLKARAAGATVMAEQQLAVDEELRPCEWFDPRGAKPRVFGRGVLDVGVLKGDTIRIYDYKSGKVKDDPLQLRVFCAFAAQHFPQVQTFDAKFIWIKTGQITGLAKPITRDEIPAIWGEILAVVERMRSAWDSEVFRYQKNGLCRNWCQVSDCPHCGA